MREEGHRTMDFQKVEIFTVRMVLSFLDSRAEGTYSVSFKNASEEYLFITYVW